MTGYNIENSDSEEDDEYLLDSLNDNRRFVIDINYNRPLKNFPLTLNKIDEVDETIKSPEAQDENGNPIQENAAKKSLHIMWNPKEEVFPITNRGKTKTRPKSASSVAEGGSKTTAKERIRPKSSCAEYPSRIPVKKKEKDKVIIGTRNNIDTISNVSIRRNDVPSKSAGSKKRYFYYDEEFDEEPCFDDYPVRPTSACCMRARSPHYTSKLKKKSKSQPNISQQSSIQNVWTEVSKFKRSLRLLGLSNSDFGLPESPKCDMGPHRPRSSHERTTPTFRTRVMEKSYSLDSLKEAVRGASVASSYPGLPERKLLSQAAYEEWYFRKTERLIGKQEEERVRAEKMRERLEIEKATRQEIAGAQFQKWLETKKKQQSTNQAKRMRLKTNVDNKLMKSKEEIDKAYLEWKKVKQRDLLKKKKTESAASQAAEREQEQKEQKKAQAEKAFQEWKKKADEAMRQRREKEQKMKDKMKEQVSSRSKSCPSFQMWKESKDSEIIRKRKRHREASKQVDEERSMVLTERQYEAQQAFEQWLDKIENRKQRSREPNITRPWAPA